MRFLFFSKKSRLAPRPNPASANHLATAIYCFCSCFFRITRSGTRLMLCALQSPRRRRHSVHGIDCQPVGRRRARCGAERDGRARVLLSTPARKYLQTKESLRRGGLSNPAPAILYRRRGSFLIPAASSWRTPPSLPRGSRMMHDDRCGLSIGSAGVAKHPGAEPSHNHEDHECD